MRAGSRAAAVHRRYLQRDGIAREGSPGELYSATADRADGRAFRGREEAGVMPSIGSRGVCSDVDGALQTCILTAPGNTSNMRPLSSMTVAG